MNLRLLVFVIVIVSYAIFGAILIWGMASTWHNGIPTISTMLQDNIDIKAMYVAGVLVFGETRFVVMIEMITRRNLRYLWLSQMAMVFGLFQVMFLLLVAVYDVSLYTTQHYTVTGLAVLFSFLTGVCNLARRVLVYLNEPPHSKWWTFALICDAFLIAALFGFTAAYVGVLGVAGPQSQHIAWLEFLIFWIVCNLNVYLLMDIKAQRVKKCKIEDDEY